MSIIGDIILLIVDLERRITEMVNSNRTLRPRRLAQVVSVAALVLLAVWVAPGLALAHAKLVSSTPAPDLTVKPGLTSIVMTFGEETSVDQSTAELDTANGTPVSGFTFAVDRTERTKMTITTPPLAVGTYTVKWKTVTEDDNGIANGTFNFTVSEGPTSPGATPVVTDTEGQGGTTEGSLPVSGVPGSPVVPVTVVLMALGLLATGVAFVRKAVRHS